MVSSQRRDLRSTLELPSPNYVYACEWGRGLVRLVFSGCFTYVNFSLYLRFYYCWSEEKRKKKSRKPLDRCWSPTLVYVSLSWIMTFIVSPGDICVLTTLWSRSQKNTLKKISDFRSWHLKEEVVAVLFKRELTFLWTEYIQLTLEGSADRPEEWGPLWAGEEGQPEEMNPMKCYLQLMQK